VITLSGTIIALIMASLAYMIGSLSTAVIVCKMMGLGDPRDSGSGNPGATNVLRLGGKLPAGLTLLGDALKGFLPVVVTWLIVKHPPTVALVALASFLGHLYPVFFDFRGGKGVATALGVVSVQLNVSGVFSCCVNNVCINPYLSCDNGRDGLQRGVYRDWCIGVL